MADVSENARYQDAVDSPSRRFASVTPSDATNLSELPKALYVGGAGNLVAIGSDDVAVTFVGLEAGSILPIRAKRVNATSTTATSIVALY